MSPGEGITASVKVIDRLPSPPPIKRLVTMTTEEKIIIPGLDHSLCKAGGLLLWKQTPGAMPTQERRHVKRRKTKTDLGGYPGKETGQASLWEDMAQW